MMWRRVIVLCSVVALFGAGCSKRVASPQLPASPPPSPVALALPGVPESAKEAQVYESAPFGYSFLYPQGFRLEELATDVLPPQKNITQYLVLMPEDVWATASTTERIAVTPSVRVYVTPKIGVVTLEIAAAYARGVSPAELEKLGYTTLHRPNADLIRFSTDGQFHTEHLVFENGEFIYHIAADGKDAADLNAQAFDLMGKTMRFE